MHATEREQDAVRTRLVDEGVARVFIGSYDPNRVVQRLGWARLRDAGIELCDFTPTLRDEIEDLLEPFRRNYTHGSVGRTARFDFNQSNGDFVIEENGARFRTSGAAAGATPSTPWDLVVPSPWLRART